MRIELLVSLIIGINRLLLMFPFFHILCTFGFCHGNLCGYRTTLFPISSDLAMFLI